MNNDNEFIWAHSVKGDLHNVIDILDDCTRNGFTSFNLIAVEKHLNKANKGLIEVKKCLGFVMRMVKEDEPKETKRKASKARTRKARRNHRRR